MKTGGSMLVVNDILVMGIVGYRRLKTSPPLLIGIAFGLLAVYNLLNLLGWGKTLWWLVVLFVLVAYIIVMVALYVMMDKKKKNM